MIMTIDEKLRKVLLRMVADAYQGRAKFAEIMSRPGITFTPEQESMIRELVSAGDESSVLSAQKIILDKLREEMP